MSYLFCYPQKYRKFAPTEKVETWILDFVFFIVQTHTLYFVCLYACILDFLAKECFISFLVLLQILPIILYVLVVVLVTAVLVVVVLVVTAAVLVIVVLEVEVVIELNIIESIQIRVV